MAVEVEGVLSDLRQCSEFPLAYGQETHGGVHAEALKVIEGLRAEIVAMTTLPSGEGSAELLKARTGFGLTADEMLPALRAAMEVADAAKEKGKRCALALELVLPWFHAGHDEARMLTKGMPADVRAGYLEKFERALAAVEAARG